MTAYYDACSCGQQKRRASSVCKDCHNRRIAPLGYAAMCRKYGEKWAVRHVQTWLKANPSDLESLVAAALDTLGVTYEREYYIKTKSSGKKARAYLIDFMVRLYPQDIAIEVNGVFAHSHHEKRDKRKMRLLKRRGIPVVVLEDEDIKARYAAERPGKAAALVELLRVKLGLDTTPPPANPGYFDEYLF